MLVPAWQKDAALDRQIGGVRTTLQAAGPPWVGLSVGGQLIDTVDSRVGEGQLKEALRTMRPRVVIASTVLVGTMARDVDPVTPLIVSGAADPVHACLVESMTKPGRNTSGYMSGIPVGGKMVELARQAFPALTGVTVVVADAADSAGFDCAPEPLRTQSKLAELQGCVRGEVTDLATLVGVVDAPLYLAAARDQGLPIRFVRVCSWPEVIALAEAHAGLDDEILLIPNRLLFLKHAAEAASLFAGHRIAAVFEGLSYAEAGGLLAVGPRRPRWPLQAATEQAMLVLSGARAGDLPVRMPASVDVWLHVGAAQTSGRLPSIDVLQRADALIR